MSFVNLEIKGPFSGLTLQEKKYAHHLSMAAWHGASAAVQQVSPESGPLLQLFFTVFSTVDISQVKESFLSLDGATANNEEDQWKRFTEYVATVYGNMGNYFAFGDQKIFPSCKRETILSIFTLPDVTSAVASIFASNPALGGSAQGLVDIIYDNSPAKRSLGYAPEGVSTYYSSNITKEEIERVDAVLKNNSAVVHGLENTRIFKQEDGTYVCRIASAQKRDGKPIELVSEDEASTRVLVEYGDYAPAMEACAQELAKAREFASNDAQRRMLDLYVEHFRTGDINAHKDSQRVWVKDKGPVVETNMGFVETYRDPAGTRAEFTGIVAFVNKERSRLFERLVSRGPDFISLLPWGKPFERDEFKRPDFTALEVFSYATGTVFVGINLPNYADVISADGFKNVVLDNISSASYTLGETPMKGITQADWPLFKKHFKATRSISTGLHELLGHGTGKVFEENDKGELNFDKNSTVNPLTGKPITTWYKPGEKWTTQFKGLANPMEECRAEGVALFLSTVPDVLEIFDISDKVAQVETMQVVWLAMVRAGLCGVLDFQPDKQKWGQAHSRARYAILRSLMQGENPVVKVEVNATSKIPEVVMDLDRIPTDGKAIIANLLCEINIAKATADVERGSTFFEAITVVDDQAMAWRAALTAGSAPRRLFVQPHSRVSDNGDNVTLEEFEPSAEGSIRSMVARHKDVPLTC